MFKFIKSLFGTTTHRTLGYLPNTPPSKDDENHTTAVVDKIIEMFHEDPDSWDLGKRILVHHMLISGTNYKIQFSFDRYEREDYLLEIYCQGAMFYAYDKKNYDKFMEIVDLKSRSDRKERLKNEKDKTDKALKDMGII